MSTPRRPPNYFHAIPEYLGPPDDSLLKSIGGSPCTDSQKSKAAIKNNEDYIYYDYFADIKALNREWKESLYEKSASDEE